MVPMQPEPQLYTPAPLAYTEEVGVPPAYDSWTVEAEAISASTDDAIEGPSMDAVEEPVLDLSNDLDEISGTGSAESFDGEPVGVYTITAEADTAVFDAFDLMPGLLEPPSIKEDVEAALDQIAAAASAPAQRAPAERRRPTLVRVNPARLDPVSVEPIVEQTVSVERTKSPRADITPWVPMYLTPGRMWPPLEGVPAETPAARSEQPDWIELVASLRQDLERRRTDPAAAAEPIAVRPSDGARATTHRLVKKPRPEARKANPVQDEWGFFDPERCGFSTLLAKLEEITEEDPRP
jgi:hypothetical protein